MIRETGKFWVLKEAEFANLDHDERLAKVESAIDAQKKIDELVSQELSHNRDYHNLNPVGKKELEKAYYKHYSYTPEIVVAD